MITIGKFTLTEQDWEQVVKEYAGFKTTEDRKNKLRKWLYYNKQGVDEIDAESSQIMWVEDVIFDNGVYMYINGMEYPSRNFAPQDDLWNANIAKRFFIETLKIIFNLPMLFVKPFNTAEKILISFNEVAYKAMKPYLWRREHLTPVAQQIEVFIVNFLSNLGFKLGLSLRTAEIMANLINIDNAYRHRIQDLFTASHPDKFKKPRKEIKRLLKLNLEREQFGTGVYKKFKMVADLLLLVLLIPKVKKAFTNALNMVEYSKLTYDQIDLFAVCTIPKQVSSYNYLGKTHEERKMMVNHLKVAKSIKKPR